MGARIDSFPLFPLEVVALPHELIPLHIFEERYREMIARCRREELEFGIVWAARDGLRSTGCACAIDRVLNEFDDGRLDILARGTRPLRIHGELEHIPYPASVIELLGDDAEALEPETLDDARGAYADLVLAVTDEPPDADRLDGMDAYAIASTVELGLEAKQTLLDLRSENARLRLVTRLLRGQLKRLERIERDQARARSNGKIRLGSWS